jgi:cysteine desulfurase
MKLINRRIYLDNNATTVVDPRVVQAIVENLRNIPGNPSSTHFFGQEARKCLSNARQYIADFLGVRSSEVIFTSGGTEGVNMVMKGIFGDSSEGHLITSNLEHSCVMGIAKHLESRQVRTTYLSPGLKGAPSLQELQAVIRSDTRLISLMAVNNETGVKTDVEAMAAIAEEAKIPFFVDGVALLGKEPFKIPQGVSAMAFSGHKIHATKGIGFVFIRQGTRLISLLTGGDQEFQRRGGTENLPAIVGLLEAIKIVQETLTESVEKMHVLRDHLEKGLCHLLQDVQINGTEQRISNTVNLAFLGVDGESLLTALDMQGIAASHGSACASGALEPSRVLLNMGIPPKVADGSIRFSLSRMTTLEEIEMAIEIIAAAVKRLRKVTKF